MVMLTVMIITNIANYFSIVLPKSGENKLSYVLYGIMLLVIYIFFAATSINTGLIYLVKQFYEIDFVRADLWPPVLVISLISSFILYIIQKYRDKIINNN